MVQRVRKLAVKLLMILLVVCSVIGLSLAMSGCATETKSIDSFVINAEGQLVVTYTDGTSTPLGKVTADDAKGITKAEINDKGELVITYTDGSSENLGVVSGQTGNGIQGIATSADGTKLVITLTNGETVEVAIPDFSCDHEQMWKDGEYDIVELGEHQRVVDEEGVETFTKTSYIVTYHCNGGHDANSDAGHAEILVNVDPIHNENTMVRKHVYATCEEAGYNGIVCDCGYAMDKEYIESEPAIGHTWSKTYLSKIDDLPYCTHGAFVTQECQNYFHADGSYHDAAPDEKCDNPNCDVASVKQDETARVVGTVEPIGHHAAAYDITNAPTYTEKGEATGVCMFCNQEFDVELPTIYQRGIIDTRTYRLDEIVLARTYCTDPGIEDYTVYLETVSKIYEVTPAEGVELSEEDLTVDLSDLIPVVEEQFTLNIKAGEHILNGKGLSQNFYENVTDEDYWDYHKNYEGAVLETIKGIIVTGDKYASCAGEGTLGEAMFVCENPDCGFNNATGEPGEKWDEDLQGVTYPVKTYVNHNFTDERVAKTPADDGCVGGTEHFCDVCKEWVTEANAHHNYTYTLEEGEGSTADAPKFVLVGVCKVEGCTAENEDHEVRIPLTVGANNDTGYGTFNVTKAASGNTAPTCYSTGSDKYTVTGTHMVDGVTYSATVSAECVVIVPMTEHVFAYDDNDRPIYASDILADGKTAADLAGYLGIDDVADYFEVESGEITFVDINKYEQLKDHWDYKAVCGPSGEAQVGIAYFTCACEKCWEAHDGVKKPTQIPVYRSHIVDPNAEDTVPGTTPATCTTAGTIRGTCTECGQKDVEMETKALGHDYVYTFTPVGTVAENGAGDYTMTINCSRKGEAGCGYTEVSGTVVVSEVVRTAFLCTTENASEPKTTYTYTVESVKNATVAGQGKELAEAIADITTLPGKFTVETNEVFHELANGELIVEGGTFTFSTDAELTAAGITESSQASCETGATGAGTFTCKGCKESIDVVTDREHDYDEGEKTEPTCTEPGMIVTTCKTCDATVTKYGDADVVAEKNEAGTEGKWEYDAKLAPLGHDYKETSRELPTFDAPGKVVLTCGRTGCDTDDEEGAQPATVEIPLPQIQASWFENVPNAKDTVIQAAITDGGYKEFKQVTVLSCGQAAQYSVKYEYTYTAEDMSKPDALKYEVSFTFVREPDADMHTYEGKPYYLQQHYSNGLLLSSVGRFCDSCGYFVVLEGNVFIGNGVEFKVEGDKITVFDKEGKQLPVYTPDQSIAAGDFGDWLNPATKPTNDVTIYDGTSITLNATYSADRTNAYNGVVFQIRSADGKNMYFLRGSGDHGYYDANGTLLWNGNYAGTVMTQPGLVQAGSAAETAAKTYDNVEITVSLSNDTMTIVYTFTGAENETPQSLTWTITGMTADSYVLGFANDGATIDGNVTISMGGLNA